MCCPRGGSTRSDPAVFLPDAGRLHLRKIHYDAPGKGRIAALLRKGLDRRKGIARILHGNGAGLLISPRRAYDTAQHFPFCIVDRTDQRLGLLRSAVPAVRCLQRDRFRDRLHPHAALRRRILVLCHWGYFSERLCRAMTETAERAAIWRLSPLYTGFRPDPSVT